MSLDDGAADGKSDSHAVVLSCVESLEQPLRSLRLESDPRIFHAKAHPVSVVSFGSDEQLPRAIFDAAHRVRGVPEQILDDLLELDAVARDGREVVR
jgi:hypothetical protein